jgi:hypothetical protein
MLLLSSSFFSPSSSVIQKPLRNALSKSDKKNFDEMWDIHRFYISACSNSVQYVRLHPILMSILLYHYKELTECISEVEGIESRVNSKKKRLVDNEKERRTRGRNTARKERRRNALYYLGWLFYSQQNKLQMKNLQLWACQELLENTILQLVEGQDYHLEVGMMT